MRWHMAKKRWKKNWGELRYTTRQNIKTTRRVIKRFFSKKHRGQVRNPQAPALKFTLGLLMASVLAGTIHFTPAIWRIYKSWSLQNKAEIFWEEGNPTEAFWTTQVSKTYRSGPDNYKTLSLLAKSAKAINHSRTIEFMEKVVQDPHCTEGNIIDLVERAIEQQQYEIAENHFSRISGLINETPRVALLHLQMIARNWRLNYNEALNLASNLIKEKQIDHHELNRIYVDLCLRTPQRLNEGLKHLYRLCRRDDKSGLEALRRILRLEPGRHITLEEKNNFFEAYRNHRLADGEDQLQAHAYGFQMGIIPHSELDAFVHKHFDIGNTESMSAVKLKRLHQWLEEISLPHKFLKYIQDEQNDYTQDNTNRVVFLKNGIKETIRKDKFLYVNYLHTMMNAGQLNDALKLIDASSNTILTKSERHLIKSIVLYKDDSIAYAKAQYELALAQARPRDLPMIDHEFQHINRTPELLKFLTNRCLPYPESEKNARCLLLQIYYEQNKRVGERSSYPKKTLANTNLNNSDSDNDGLSDATEVEDGTDPNNPDSDGDGAIDGVEKASGTDPLNDQLKQLAMQMRISDYTKVPKHLATLIYIKILHKLDLEECLSTMEMLASKSPETPRNLVVLALAYYMNNKLEKALSVIQESQIDYLYRSPSNQTIAAVILDANNRVKDSRIFLKDLNPEDLIPAERLLLDQRKTVNIFPNSPYFQEIIQN
jgi:hypothetical protein